MRILPTRKFSVIDSSNSLVTLNDGIATGISGTSVEHRGEAETEHNYTAIQHQRQSSTTQRRMGIFLDIDEPYTRDLIQRALRHPSRAPHFHITLGPGIGFEPVPLPRHCQFQWSEYENRLAQRCITGSSRGIIVLHPERTQSQGTVGTLYASTYLQIPRQCSP